MSTGTPDHSASRGPVVLLGPQRRDPTVRAVLAELSSRPAHRPGAVAVVTAGWEEREDETGEFIEHLEKPVINLALHRRALEVFAADPELLGAVQACHDELSELQRLYRLQLRHLLRAARQLLSRTGREELLEEHRATAFENLRNLDAHHGQRVHEIRERTGAELGLRDRQSLAPHREQIAAALGEAEALCIAGGHVGVLFNRLWLFDVLAEVPPATPVVAWSAGAMALCERIVLFHDCPPEGRGHAELLGPGFGRVRGVVPFPHARHRLRLEQAENVILLARRFPDDLCLTFDAGARVTADADGVRAEGTARRLDGTGAVVAAMAGEGA